MIYLADKSAWAQLPFSEAAQERFQSLHEAYQLAICAPIAAELLFSARNEVALRRQREDLDSLRWLPLSPDAERRMFDVQQMLARRGHHRSVGVVDLLVAVTAEHVGAVVLHYDGDFERIARVTGQAHEWIVPRATGHGATPP